MAATSMMRVKTFYFSDLILKQFILRNTFDIDTFCQKHRETQF